VLLRSLVPYPLRVEVARMRRMPDWILERFVVAKGRGEEREHPFVLARHRSPLRRAGKVDEALQAGKERNVALAAARLDRVKVPPFGLFSYHHLVGRPSRWRGFRPGLELRNGTTSSGIGGGCCQISNLVHWLALLAGMKIVERHRHALDLFPDDHRAVPFGSGATVFYNYADLRFENPLDEPVLLRLVIEDRGGALAGELRTTRDPGWRVEVREVDHRFFRDEQGWWRENRLRRRFLLSDGTTLRDEEVAHNLARVLYHRQDPRAHAQDVVPCSAPR
jgi:vancomycin resistance protein VanW